MSDMTTCIELMDGRHLPPEATLEVLGPTSGMSWPWEVSDGLLEELRDRQIAAGEAGEDMLGWQKLIDGIGEQRRNLLKFGRYISPDESA
jgi:hypothetical protein